MFSPNTQKILGDAAIVVDGEHLYIGSNKWMMLLLQPENFLDPGLVEFIREIDPSDDDSKGYIDWRLLNQVGIDVQNLQFLPAGSRRYQSLYHHRGQGFLHADLEGLREAHNENISHSIDPRVNLSALYRGGKMRPIYSQSKVGDEGSPVRGNHVETYLYADDQYVFGVMGPMMQLCAELDIDLYTSTLREGRPPPQGAMDLERGVVLLVGPMLPSLPKKAPDGRKVHADPARLCWYREEDGYESIASSTSPFDPLLDQETIIDRLLGVDGGLPSATSAGIHTVFDVQREGISILRWHGVPEHQIREELEQAQVDAWPRVYKSSLDQIISDIDSLEDQKSSPLTPWGRKHWENRVRTHCARMEKFRDLISSEIPQQLEVLVGLLDSLTSEN